MKKVFKSLFTALLFAFVIAALSGLGTVKASAAELTADLDGDGTDETIVYEITERDDYGMDLTFLTINGKDVLAAGKLDNPFYGDRLEVSVVDTCTKDGVKELLIAKGVDSMTENYLFRFKSGKVSKYCVLEGDEIVSQKKKSRITVKDYVLVNGIGNIFTNITYKVKSGRAVFTDEALKPNKNNERTSFKTTKKLTVYSDYYVSEEIATLKKGAKIKIVKFERDGEGNFTRICIKSGSVTGWIDTMDCDSATFIVKNPPLWN
ncbi:MAG: hypothetical protein J5728_11020 [Lachnospiraceae bacterium]|nr:hypothetical protein [Lachnospiraceae bacterium]